MMMGTISRMLYRLKVKRQITGTIQNLGLTYLYKLLAVLINMIQFTTLKFMVIRIIIVGYTIISMQDFSSVL